MPYRDMPKRDMGARITEKEGLEEVAGGKNPGLVESKKDNKLFDFNSKFFPTIKE